MQPIIPIAIMVTWLFASGPAQPPREPSDGSRNAPFTMVGATLTSGASSSLNGSFAVLGQSLAGTMSNSAYTIQVGVVPVLVAAAPAVPGDGDGDGDVDLDDFVIFVDCLFGPDTMPNPTLPGLTAQECLAIFDFSSDNDVDLQDFSVFARVFTG